MYPSTQKAIVDLFLEFIFRKITNPFEILPAVIFCALLAGRKRVQRPSLGPSWLCSTDGFQLGHSSSACLFPASCLAPLCSPGCGEDTHVQAPSAGPTGHFQGLPMQGGTTLLFSRAHSLLQGTVCKVHASCKSLALTTHLSFSLFLLYWKFPFNLWWNTFSCSSGILDDLLSNVLVFVKLSSCAWLWNVTIKF